MKKYCFAAFALLFLTASCGVAGTDPDTVEVKPAEPISLTRAEEGLVIDANAFGFKVFEALETAAPATDRFISPLSLSLALAMTATGAAGDTQAEMIASLGFGNYTGDQMGGFYKKMIPALVGADPITTFRVANAIWASRDITVKQKFISDASLYYNSEIHVDDFSLPATAKAINDWCSKNTEGKIPKIVDDISPDIKMILLNALYFLGKWEEKFPNAVSGKFTTAAGSSVSAKLMSQTGSFAYAEAKGFQAVELPYGNGAFVMDLLLPAKGADWAGAVSSLKNGGWDAIMNSMSSSEVSVTLPVFKMEYEADLSDILIALGMGRAFSGAADFSAMSTTPLCISSVRQKTYVDVNEKGTEAAAVTIVDMKCTSVGPSETKIFRADRPFIFAIREVSTGSVLFLGQKMK